MTPTGTKKKGSGNAKYRSGRPTVCNSSRQRRQKIGLAPLKKGAIQYDLAYAIKYHPNQRQAAIDTKSFLRQIGWDGHRCQLDAHWNQKDKLWECNLPDWKTDGLKLLPQAVSEQRTGVESNYWN